MSMHPAGPIVIGGVGGSGTRLVAQIVEFLGYRLGSDLNQAKDNLWFNLLFYRPEWLLTGPAKRSKGFERGFELLRKHAYGEHRLSAAEAAFVARAVADVFKDRVAIRHPWRWSALRLRNFLRTPGLEPDARGWGWKSPISHLIVDEVLGQFPEARYMHVLRHGLDMSFSDNQNQLRRIGFFFDVPTPPREADLPPAALTYWVRANRRALEIMKRYGPERSLIVNFDRLCTEPLVEIESIVRFFGLAPENVDMQALAQMPHRPASIGRHRGKPLVSFPAADLAAVTELGFSVESVAGADLSST